MDGELVEPCGDAGHCRLLPDGCGEHTTPASQG